MRSKRTFVDKSDKNSLILTSFTDKIFTFLIFNKRRYKKTVTRRIEIFTPNMMVGNLNEN